MTIEKILAYCEAQAQLCDQFAQMTIESERCYLTGKSEGYKSFSGFSFPEMQNINGKIEGAKILRDGLVHSDLTSEQTGVIAAWEDLACVMGVGR